MLRGQRSVVWLEMFNIFCYSHPVGHDPYMSFPRVIYFRRILFFLLYFVLSFFFEQGSSLWISFGSGKNICCGFPWFHFCRVHSPLNCSWNLGLSLNPNCISFSMASLYLSGCYCWLALFSVLQWCIYFHI